MKDTSSRAVAIVGVSAILPDAPDAQTFWENIKNSRYSVSEVPEGRWDPALYYDPDHSAPDKTYSKIGGWVRDWQWEPHKWKLPIPPTIADAMDDSQKWAVALAHAALVDYGDDQRPLDRERTAVILGTAMGGELHYQSAMRIFFPEFAGALAAAPAFAALPEDVRNAIHREARERLRERMPGATEDTMPGELANCMAGRVANLFNLNGPNYICDAACASALAAIDASVEGLIENEFDAVLTGGIDRNMGASTYVKFCKIGALSATGTRPYADGADGFVMGEGAAMFVLKRLEDAERNGDRIYAVLRGVGGASDGRGKGITAPNPTGQRLALRRAWDNAGLSPATVGLVEGHGTSTRVGDVVEFESLNAVFGGNGARPGSVALGSVKSNIGHLKSGAGAAGLLKAALSLHDKVLPPSLNFVQPNPNINFAESPFYVNTELRAWDEPGNDEGVRRAGVSAFGFGGTNFHLVLEEYIPGRLRAAQPTLSTARSAAPSPATLASGSVASTAARAPLQGVLVLGADSKADLYQRLQQLAESGDRPPPGTAPGQQQLNAGHRLAISYADAEELGVKITRAGQAFKADQGAVWKALRSQGVYYGNGPAPKVAFLYTGQGSQYPNMLSQLRQREPIIAETFAEADRIMEPLIGGKLSEIVFVDPGDSAAMATAEQQLRRTEITQPAVLTVDTALTRLYAAYGIEPDMVMGHSLGEYGALVASGSLSFAQALEAVSARGREMVNVSWDDNGLMAAVFAPLQKIQEVVDATPGDVVIANINSYSQAVIGGTSAAVRQAITVLEAEGVDVALLPVSHAFHTSIVAPASEPLRKVLQRMQMAVPSVPLVANVSGEFYPSQPGCESQMVDMLAQQVASPVQFVKGLNTLFDAGARVFVEVGPKKALQGFTEDVLGAHEDVLALCSNHPKVGDIPSFNHAMCGLHSVGLGVTRVSTDSDQRRAPAPVQAPQGQSAQAAPTAVPLTGPAPGGDRYQQLGHMFAEFLERGWQVYRGDGDSGGNMAAFDATVVTGAALGLPGGQQVFDDSNVQRILDGEQEIDVIPTRFRHAIVDKHITRLVKSGDGDPHFEAINSTADVIKLAGRGGKLDLEQDFGVPAERIPALDITTQLAMAAGIDALRDAGIPLVMHYRTTHKGTRLPERWMLPESMRDDTGIVFAAAFPGYDAFADELTRYQVEHGREAQLEVLRSLRERLAEEHHADAVALAEIEHRIHEVEQLLETEPYQFDRRFLFRTLAMGHSQMAEYIGARGPNTHVNSACASTTQAFAIAEDWIRVGRCRRVLVIAADDVTSDHLLEWVGAGFLASGAAATDGVVEDAALPFDRRRHGMIMGMGACGVVVEHREAAAERGLRPICEVLSTVTANSAFHGTRLNIDHICEVMEKVVSQAEQRFGIDRRVMARELLFVSHETYTPARGGSASAEVHALRSIFGDAADQIVVANTKGLTGHAMGVGIEDTVAIKALETGVVPPVANFREQDPELGPLNLSRGGVYPIRYALRLGAGFGSQISMSLMRWVPSEDGTRPDADRLGYEYRLQDPASWTRWLQQVTGNDAAEVEIVQRTLRVKEGARTGQAARPETPAVAPVAPAAVPAAAVAPAPAAATTATAAPVDAVTEQVLNVVAGITGYPTDMLELDLDLEADLGIDTVKQAETFAAIREQYDIPRDENLKLRDYPSIAHAVQFVMERRPDLATASPAPAPATAETAAVAQTAADAPAAATGDEVTETVLAIVAGITGYPTDMLELDLDLEADLGIDTVKQAETFAAIREQYGIPRDENLKLRDYPSIAHAIQFVRERRPDLVAETPPPSVDQQAPAAAVDVPATGDDEVTRSVLAIVSRITGYPTDMLELDLDLEADLGIDTVKQAETFAAIREQYDIPRDENLKLRDYPSIAHAIQFVHERAPGAGSGGDSATAAAQVAAAESGASPLRGDMAAADAVPRRVPQAVLRPVLELCKPTGVTLDSNSRVVLMPDEGGVGKALAGRLEKLGVTVLTLATDIDRKGIQAQLQQWQQEGPISGVYWLAALDIEASVAEMDLAQWRAALELRVKLLYQTMRTLYGEFDEPGSFLLVASRLGGKHGYDERGAIAPMGGAVTGFAKAFSRERPQALVKAVDFEDSRKTGALADVLVEETCRDPGAVEIGFSGDQRWSVAVVEQAAADGEQGMVLNGDTVFVVTGAAGSIVSAITADLASNSGGTFYLLDLVPAPDPQNSDIRRVSSDRDGLKRDIFERLKASGERVTPAMVERELAGLERSSAALMAVEAVQAAGGTARYLQVDLTDSDAVAAVVATIGQAHGRIDVLLHAAGIEISHFLPDKPEQEFDLVIDVKCEGWFNLLRAIGDMPLGTTVVFSSIAGRFGNMGQTDYSAANDLLCKMSGALSGTRGIAIDWTAWADIGMASRGGIPAMMAQAGIDMLAPEAGIPVIRRELTAGGRRGEVVIAGNLGVLMQERDASGGLDTTALDERIQGPMLGTVVGMSLHQGLQIETPLSPTEQPFLYDHQIDGTPVLPGVMAMEAFGEMATLMFPSLHINALEDVEFQAPFKFYRSEPQSLHLSASFDSEGDEVLAHCRCASRRKLHGQDEEQVTTHFVATVRLGKEVPAAETVALPPEAQGPALAADDLYQVYFHGPAYQVLDLAWCDGDRVVGRMRPQLPPNHEPAERRLVLAPRLIELCFQSAGSWEIGSTSKMGLPRGIRRVGVCSADTQAEAPLHAIVQTREEANCFDALVVDGAGQVLVTLEDYQSIEYPGAIAQELLAPFKAAMVDE